MKIPENILQQYARSRRDTYKSIVCHAPFVNLNFEQNGNVRACCYNFTHILGRWPEQNIKEIWKSAKSDELRNYIRKDELGGGCSECGNMLVAGNHYGVRAKYYDEFAPPGLGTAAKYLKNRLTGSIGYPRIMEFELSSKCNLECVMCNGYFSSAIRKNREKLPPIESPYNDDFVDELDEFLPHLTDARFLGGEPFMIDIYLKIWERIRKINPKIRIHITTNGTFLTDRVKDLLESLNAGIILSIDSVNRDTYHKIRVNGNFDKVMTNVEFFREYTARKGTFISMAACPITYNWHELPEMLEFCIDKNISLYFNAVFTPVELALKEQPLELQEQIITHLKNHPAPELKGEPWLPRNLSITAYNDFVKQLEGWISDRKNLLTDKEQKLKIARNMVNNHPKETAQAFSLDAVADTIFEIIEIDKKGLFAEEKKKQEQLAYLLTSATDAELGGALRQFITAHEKFNNLTVISEAEEKTGNIASMINKSGNRNLVLTQMAFAPPLQIAQFFLTRSVEDLQGDLQKFAGN